MADKKDKMFDGDADFDKIPEFGDDIGSYEGFDDSQNSGNAREPIISRMLHDVGSTLNYAGSKAGEGFASGIRDKLNAAMPEVTGAYDTATQAVGEAQMGWSDMVSQTRPVLNKLKITSKQLIRNMHDVIPLGLDQKLLNFLDNHFPDEEKFKEPSLKEQREANLSNVLGEVFKLQTEKAMETQQNDMVNRTIDDRLTQNRHAESIAIEGATKNAVLFQAEFTKNIYTAYLKKDLELKYRHFYVAQDTLSTLVNTTKMLQERLTAIVKNTGLPDSQKIQINELAKKKIKEKFLSTLGDKTTNLFTTLRENWSKQIVKPFISILETVNDAIAGFNDIAEQENTMAEMGGSDEPAIFSYKRGAGAGISMLASILGRKAMGGVLKLLPKSTRDRIEAIASHPLRRLRNKMMDLAKSTDETGEPTLWGLAASKLLGSFNNNYKLENYSYKNLMNPGSITNKTILTIEQVIPGYLSMQTKFLEMMAMHNDHAEQKVWDFKTKKFVTEKEHTTSNLKSIFGNRKQRGSALGAYATKSVQNVKSVYSNDNHKAQSLIALYQMNAKQIETFKFGLAFSDKHIRIDKRFLNTIKEIAKCKDVNQIKDDIKTSDIWKYGFKHCGRPISVANYLEAFLTFDDDAHKGELNPEAALRLEDEIENINEEKVPRIKEAIFDADERGDNEFVNSLGTRNEDGTLDIDPAKLVEIFSDNISEGDFDKSFDKNMILASKDKNWSPDKTTLVEDAWHKLKTAIDNGTIGQTLNPIFDKVINIGKNIHKYISVNWFGEKDKDVERRENAIKKKFEEAENFIKKTWQDGKQLAADAKKNLQQFFNKTIANAITNLLISDNDSTFKHVYRVFFYTKEDGEKLAGMPRADIDAGSVLAEIVQSRDIRKAFKEFARSAAKNKNYQIVSDLLKDSFTWFNDIMLMFEEHDGKTEIDDLMQYDNDEKKLRKKFGEKLQSIKNWQSTRSIKGISGANQLAKEEDEAAEAEKKKNNISTDTRQKKTVTQYDLLFKSEQHLFKIEGALADIHAIYISEHKGYEGLVNARDKLNKELRLVNNPNYNYNAERDALFTKYQKKLADANADFYNKYQTKTEQEKHESELKKKTEEINKAYEQDIKNLDAKRYDHYTSLTDVIAANKARSEFYSKNASYADTMLKENASASQKALDSMIWNDRDEAVSENNKRDYENNELQQNNASNRKTQLREKRRIKATIDIIDSKYKNKLLEHITPKVIEKLLDKKIITKKPIGNHEQQAEAVYEECKKNGRLNNLLKETGMTTNKFDTEVTQQMALNKIATKGRLVFGNFKNASGALADEWTPIHKNSTDIRNKITNYGESILKREYDAEHVVADNAKKIAQFKLLFKQIKRKYDANNTYIEKALQDSNTSKTLTRKLKTRSYKIEKIIDDIKQNFGIDDIDNIPDYTADDITPDMIAYLSDQLKKIPDITEEQYRQYVSDDVDKVGKAESDIAERTKQYRAKLSSIGHKKGINYRKARESAKADYDKDMESLNRKLSYAKNILDDRLKSINGGLNNLSRSDQKQFDADVHSNISLTRSELNNAQTNVLGEDEKNSLEEKAKRRRDMQNTSKQEKASQRFYSYLDKLNDLKNKLLPIKANLDTEWQQVKGNPRTKNTLQARINHIKQDVVTRYLRYVDRQIRRAYLQDESISKASFDLLKQLDSNLDKLDNFAVNSSDNVKAFTTNIDNRIKFNQDIENIKNGNTKAKEADLKKIEEEKEKIVKDTEQAIAELTKPYQEAKSKYNSEMEQISKEVKDLEDSIKTKRDELQKLLGSRPGVKTEEQYNKDIADRDAKLKKIDDDINAEKEKYNKEVDKIRNDPNKIDEQKFEEIAKLKQTYERKIDDLKKKKEEINAQPIQGVMTEEQVDTENKKIDEQRAEIKKIINELETKRQENNKKIEGLKQARKLPDDIRNKIKELRTKQTAELQKLDAELTAINDPKNQKYKDKNVIESEVAELTKAKGSENRSGWKTLIKSISNALMGIDQDHTKTIEQLEKEVEEKEKKDLEKAKNATKHATGGNYIKDGTSLEKFGGVTNGWTSVLNGTGIAGEAGAETILPHKANERFKKLIYNAIALTFGKTAADRATRALHPNKSTMEQLDMDVDMYAKGTNRTGRRRKVTNEQRKNRRIKRRNRKAAQQAADGVDDDSDGDTVETTTDETTQPEERSLFGKLWDSLKGFWNKSKEEVEAEENQTTTETKKDEDGRRKVTLDSSIKEILFAQLETLREIADKSFIGLGFGNWHIGEAFKDLKGWVGKKYQGFKNWLNSSHWLGDKVKGLLLSPLRITDSLIRNRVFNVYELPAGKDEEVGNPLITVDDFKNGLYTDAELKNRLKSVDDIKGPIWNKDGKQVISEKNIEAGLCDEHKKPINSFARQIGRFLRRRLGNVRDLAKGIGAGGWSFVKGLIFNEVFDIYKNPQDDKLPLGNPVITVADFEVGIYLDAECTKRIKSVADITGAVYDNTGKLKVKEEDLPLLCDVNRKPINNFAARLGRFFRRRLSIVPSIVKSPLRFVDSLLFNNVCNVYKNPGSDKEKLAEPLIRVDDFEAGLYLDKEKTKKITSVADITGPVYDHTGTCRITEEDIKAGLVDEDRKPINSFAARLGRTFRHGIGGIFSKIANLHPIQTLKKVAMAPINFLSWVNKRNVDVYSKRDPKKLLVAAKDIEEGLLQYANGEIVKAASDIDQPVWWTDNAKNGAKAKQIAISQEDIDAGLIENDGTDIKGRLGIAGDISKHAISSVAKLGGKIITAPIKLGKFLVKELIIGENDPFIDVYVVDRRYKTGLRRALEGTKIESGAYYTLKEDGTTEPLKAAYDIGSEVYETVNNKPKCLITKKNLKDGLYDANGKRIHKGRLNGLAIRAGSALIHGTGKLIRGAWNGIKSVAGKGLDLAGNLFSKIFGSDVFDRIGGFFKNLFHPTSFFLGRRDLYELVTVQLMKIYDLLDQRMKKPKNVKGDADGDGDRDGSYEDFEQKLKERKAERKAKQDERKKKEKEEKEKQKKEKKEKEQQKKAEEAAENDDSGFLDSLMGTLFGSWIGSGRKKPGTPTPETAGGKKGIFKKLFGKLFSPFVKRGAGAGAAGNAAGQAATRAGTQTIAEGAGVLQSARTQLPTNYVDYATRLTGGKPNGIPNLIESAGSRFARAGAAGNVAGQAAARTGAQAAGNTVKKGLLHRLGNIGTKIVGKSAARAVLGASVAALNVVPIVGQIINIAFWGATAATIGYEILKTNPMDLRWQRIRFPAYGLDKSGTFYEFAYEDSIKDLEKETFKAVIKGKQAADDSAIEHFGQSIGFLAGSIGLTFSDKAIKERERRLTYLRYWYYLRFLAPFLAYCEVISAYRPDNIPETDFPDPATINFDLQDQAIDTYKKQLDKIKTNKKVYDDRFDLTDETKYKKWVGDSEKAKEEAKKNMSVGERALAEAMETDNINDDNFDYTNTKNYFSQMWYNIKHGNLIDATGDAIMGVGSVIGETVSGVISLVFKDWIWHGLGFGSTNYQDAWHKAKIVLYGLDEKVDIDDLEDFEETVGPIINKRESELKQDDLLDEVDDLLDETDYDTDDFIDAAVHELDIDENRAKQKVSDYIYAWYSKRFKVVLGSFLVIGRIFKGKKDSDAIDKFDVEDIPDEAREEVLQSFTKKTEEQLKKNDSEKYKLTIKDFVEFLRSDEKLEDSSKRLKKNRSFSDYFKHGRIPNEKWSFKAAAAVGLHVVTLGAFKIVPAFMDWASGTSTHTEYEQQWEKRYKYYNFGKNIYDPSKTNTQNVTFNKKIEDLEDIAADVLNKKKSIGSEEVRLEVTKIAAELGFSAWKPGDHTGGILASMFNADIAIANDEFSRKIMYAKSKYLMDWFKMTFLPIFSIFAQVVRSASESKDGDINVEAIPEARREDAINTFIKSADVEVAKSKDRRVVLGMKEFGKYYTESLAIAQGKKLKNPTTNALNILAIKEREKDEEEKKILNSSVNNNSLVTSLTKVDQNIFTNVKVKLKNANLPELRKAIANIKFIDPDLSQQKNWRRIAYWAYGVFDDNLNEPDHGTVKNTDSFYGLIKALEQWTFIKWYHSKDSAQENELINKNLEAFGKHCGLLSSDDIDFYHTEKMNYLREWYDNRFVPMFWTLTKVIEQQHSAGNGDLVDLTSIETNGEIFNSIATLPEPEFHALVLAAIDELRKQLNRVKDITPYLEGYKAWKKKKSSAKSTDLDSNEKTVDTSIDKMYEQFDKTVADAKAKDKSTSYSNSMFTKDSINRKLLKKSVSINTNEIPNMNYSYVHANEFADNTEPVQKFASGGVISRPTKLGRNILAGEAGTETILPHKAGKNFNNLVTNAVSDAYDRNTASAVNMILAGSNAATDTTIDAINRKYGQTINGTGSNWQDAAYRRSLERYYITDEELDEPLSSSTDLLLFNIYKKISIVSNVFEKASTGKKFDTVNPEKNKSVFDSIKDTLSDGWETIKSGASSAWDTVTSAASGAWDSATSAVSAGFSAAKEYGGAMIDGAKSLLGFGDSNKSVQSGNISKDAEDTAMRIWKYFKSKGWSDQAIAGLLGNMYKESRLSSLRLQGDLSQDLAKSKVYTEKADKDLNFFKHGIGYGLCQWTYGARKENLWKFCHDKGVSVGDTNMQIAFVDYEINNGGMSKRFRDILMHSNDVNMATAIILKVYEKPARMDDPAELQERTRYAHEWYDKMTKKGNDSSIWSTVSDVSQYVVDKGKQVLQFGKEVAGAVGSSIKDTATDIANGNFGNIVSRTTQGAVDLGNDVVEAINSSKNAEVVCPTDAPVITSQFGKRHVKGGSSNHQGIDLRAKPIGQPIYAAEAGTVSYVNPKSYGAIWIEQQDGLQARYLHNSKILVKKGDKVKAGQMIALSGGTDKFGNVSHYPPHLHFEIRRNKQPIDPEIWLRSKGIKLSLDVGHTTSAHMPPLSDVGVETIDNKGREVTTPEIPAYANGSSSYYQTADQNIKSTETAQGATGNASSNVGIVSTAADSILQDKNAHSAVSTSTKAEPVSTEAPVITTDSVASGNIGTDTSSIGNQQLAELKIISGLLRDIRNGEKTVPDRKIDTETTLNSTSANTSETDALSQLIPILQTIADKLSDTSTTTPIINQTTTGIPTKKRQFAFPLDIAKRA